jgi:uncharacterized protein YyaL (SSP411 family)
MSFVQLPTWSRAWLVLFVGACSTTALPTATHRDDTRAASAHRAEPDYQPLTKQSFERAASERRIIVLSVQAAWCHWCHVMNAETLQDPEVLALLGERFLIIRVDADARPDIATRYAAWGWPATALLTPQAQSIVNLRGHQPKARFLALLRELTARQDRGQPLAVASATRGQSTSAEHAPELVALRDLARSQIARAYDPIRHGYGGPKKYPHIAPIEAALIAAAAGEQPAMITAAFASLDRYRSLVDPVDGGIFQYSVWNDWNKPHYEKIHAVQADALRIYAEVSRARIDGIDAQARTPAIALARDIARYVLGPLRAPSGAFYANQDADVGHPGEPGHMAGERYYALSAAERRAVRAPRIDTNVYANYNGMAIAALCALYEATGDTAALAAAERAYQVIEQTHRKSELYRHTAEPSDEIFHLTDQIEMGYALLALYTGTARPAYRARLAALLDATRAVLFDDSRRTFASHTAHNDAVGVLAEPLISLEDNARIARLMLRAGAVTNDEALRERALTVLRALASHASDLLIASPTPDAPELVALRQGAGDYALALETALAPYAVLTVVGPLDDTRTQALLVSARGYYHPSRLLRHDAPGEGKYPYPGEPVVYLCNDNACSMPVRDPARLADAANAFMAEQR